jgi:hypothetical protein
VQSGRSSVAEDARFEAEAVSLASRPGIAPRAGTRTATFFYLPMQFYYFYGFVALALALPIVFSRRTASTAAR